MHWKYSASESGFTSREEKHLCAAYMVPYIELRPSVTSRFIAYDFTKRSALFPSGNSHRKQSGLHL